MNFKSLFLYFFSLAVHLLRYCHPEWHPRSWSNAELRFWGKSFTGDVINISSWDDRDKEGGVYADYFPNKSSYTVSNIGGARGATGYQNEIYLDLTEDLPESLNRRFDVVFNHTTLEHIYDIRKAVANLCALSRDVVIVVVPFMQPVHYESGSYLDYWRLTPFALTNLFRENGFEILYWSHNDNAVFPVYLFCICSCYPDKWRSVFPVLSAATLPDALGRSWSSCSSSKK